MQSTRAAEFATLFADSPDLSRMPLDRACRMIAASCAELSEAEIEAGLKAYVFIRAARTAYPKTDLQRLIEHARLVHGTKVTASLLIRHMPCSRDDWLSSGTLKTAA